MARLLAGLHPVLRLCLVRADRSGARRSGAACLCRRPLLAAQLRRHAGLRLPRSWSRRGEFLSIFFAMVARFAPVERDEDGRLALCWPGAKLLAAEPLPASGVAFLLLALSSVSFDGLSKTFFWLGLFGVNPLEFPGRTALIGNGTFGLVLTFVLLAAVFLLAVVLGQRLAGGGRPFARGGRPAGLVDRADRARLPFRALSDGAAGRRPICACRPVRPVRAGLEPVRHRRHADRSRHRRRARRPPGGCGTSRPAPSSPAMCWPCSSPMALPGACIRGRRAPRSASCR